MDPLVIAFGLGVGVLIGLTGIGGGSLMTPLLILFAGIPPIVAIGTDLAYGAVTKTRRRLAAPAQGHRRPRRLEVAGLRLGARLDRRASSPLEALRCSDSPTVLLTGVAVALLVVSLSILFRALFLRAAIERERHTVVLDRATRSPGAVGHRRRPRLRARA